MEDRNATPEKGVVVNLSYVTLVRLVILSLIGGAVLHCANPVDEPLAWRSRIAAPLTNERFMVAEELDSIFEFDSLRVIKEDTLSFAVNREDSATYERIEPAFDTMYKKVKVGELDLQKMERVDKVIPYDTVGDVGITFRVPLRGVRNILFSSNTENILGVTFTNSTTTDLENVSMTIEGVTDTKDLVAAQAAAVFNFLMAGVSVQDSLLIGMTMRSSTRTTGAVGIEFSMNGLSVFSMEVQDSLIAFREEYTNKFLLTDTMDLDFVDISRGSFVYSILNHCGVAFNLQCVHDHIWQTSYCEENDYTDVTDLTGIMPIDSTLYFRGGVPGQRIQAGPNTKAQLQVVHLGGTRLFPMWDDSLETSITNVNYIVEILSTGEWVTITALDSLMFTIATNDFGFGAMAGTFVQPITYEVDTQKIVIELPWHTTVKDSLRGRFILSSVIADLVLQTQLGGSSQVDTLDMDIFAFDPDSPSVVNSLSTRFVQLSNDSTYSRSMDITKVANLFSDSIALAVRMSLPTGTYVRFESDTRVTLPPGAIGRMMVEATTDFDLNAKLDWEIVGTVNMDLGTSRVPLPEALDILRKMSDRTALFEMWVRNNSNLQMSLFSLAAPDALMDTLDSLTMNEVFAYINNREQATADGYINLFDSSGITIPARDTVDYAYNQVTLDDDRIQLLLATDSLNFRWWIQFKEQERDALLLTDYLDIRSRIDIRGDNNTDSLFIWE